MIWITSCLRSSALAAIAWAIAAAAPLGAPLSADPPARLIIKAGETAASRIRFQLAPGYHTNSHTPSEDYLIPLRLTWEAAPLEVAGIDYPAGHMEKYSFADKPLSVYSGAFDVTTRFRAPASAPKGSRTLTGKLRYQACTDKLCLPPKTLTVELAVDIR